MPVVPKGVIKSEKYWKDHCAQVKRTRDIELYQYLNKHPYALKVKDYPAEDKKALQMMNLTRLRTFILDTAMDKSLASSKYELAQEYTISEIVAILLERTLNVGLKLEALADINYDEMFKEAEIREENLSEWVKEQTAKIESGE